jgi:hypothetical protein
VTVHEFRIRGSEFDENSEKLGGGEGELGWI